MIPQKVLLSLENEFDIVKSVKKANNLFPLEEAPFSNLFTNCKCPKCKKVVMLDLSRKNIVKYGFICPFCNVLTNGSEMWRAIAETGNFIGEC